MVGSHLGRRGRPRRGPDRSRCRSASRVSIIRHNEARVAPARVERKSTPGRSSRRGRWLRSGGLRGWLGRRRSPSIVRAVPATQASALPLSSGGSRLLLETRFPALAPCLDENFKRARPPVQSGTVNKGGHLEQAKRKSQIRRRREAALVVPVRRLPPGRSCGRSRRAGAPAAFQPLSCQAAPVRAPQWHRHRVSGRRCGFS